MHTSTPRLGRCVNWVALPPSLLTPFVALPTQLKLVSELLTCDIEKILLDESIQLSLYERIEFAAQAAEGMAWLHGAGVIHW